MIRKLYNWSIGLAEKPYALMALFFYAFAEASFFPLPVELMLIPMILSRRQKWLLITSVAVLGSGFGAILGYGIGALGFETIGRPILEMNHAMDEFDKVAKLYNDWGVWAVVIGGLTPLPFKLVTIASGVSGFNFITFVLTAFLARALRYGIIGWLLYYFGEPIRHFIEKRLELLFVVATILFFAGFFVLRYL